MKYKTFKRCMCIMLMLVVLVSSIVPANETFAKTNKTSVKLAKPVITKCAAYESGKIELRWSKVDEADYYYVFRSTKKKSGFVKVKSTKKCYFYDKKGAAYTTYYYRVVAVKKATATTLRSKSKMSLAVKKKVRKVPQKIAYIGDSVMSGFAAYGVLRANERSFAKVSLYVHALNTKEMGPILAYNPDRAYIMIGTNDCVGQRSNATLQSIANEYLEVVQKLHNTNPNMEIVVLGIGNTRSNTVPNSNVNTYNAMVSANIEKLSYAKYFDTGSVLNDATGSLAASYSAGDGIHWGPSAYRLMQQKMDEFVAVY